jgi:hypothetical protein
MKIACRFHFIIGENIAPPLSVFFLSPLFLALLHELMTAKTRVHELELPTKGEAV